MPRRASRAGKGSKSSKTARVLGLLTNPGNVDEEGAAAAQDLADQMDDRAAQAEIRSALEQELLGLLPNGDGLAGGDSAATDPFSLPDGQDGSETDRQDGSGPDMQDGQDGSGPDMQDGQDGSGPDMQAGPDRWSGPESAMPAAVRSAYDALAEAEDEDDFSYTEERSRGRHRRRQRELEEDEGGFEELEVPAPENAAEPKERLDMGFRRPPDVYESAPEPEEGLDMGFRRPPDVYESAPEPEEGLDMGFRRPPDVYESAPEPGTPSAAENTGYSPLADLYQSAPQQSVPDALSGSGGGPGVQPDGPGVPPDGPSVVPAEEKAHVIHDWNPPHVEESRENRENLVSGHPEEWICFNLTQALVDEKTDKYMRLFGMCTCPRCKVDVTAIALTNLPVKYVATQNRDIVPLLSMYETKYSAEVISQVISACKKVMTRPHHGRR